MGYIYIMKNPAFPQFVKIGYADDPERRRKELSGAVPISYELVATYKTTERLKDKTLHRLIDELDGNLRYDPSKEFYAVGPDMAIRWLQAIAEISGTTDRLDIYNNDSDEDVGKKSVGRRRPPIDYIKCGIPIGAEFNYINDKSITVKVLDGRHVEYNGIKTSISAVAKELLGTQYRVNGVLYFTYNGKPVSDYYEMMFK
ncbi:MAG: GIY-YIG nuclease family protein [Erysipelotrichaceae bacterium]|nr:GIY-YIG nuclease family protein [Erysipelotrichaceae bacterium]